MALRPAAGSMKIPGGSRGEDARMMRGGDSGGPRVAKTRTTVGARDPGQFSQE